MAHLAARSVQHAFSPPPKATAAPPAACGHCGKEIPPTKSGDPRKNGRWCSSACRAAATRDRRAQARADLVAALGELRQVEARVEEALAVLGFMPGQRAAREEE